MELSEIRHNNARRILKNNCNGKVITFASKINKKYQQCSSFLRLKNPVNIGDKVARQIESTFGYKSGWLDVGSEHTQELMNKNNSSLVYSFERIKDALDDINSKVTNGLSGCDTMYMHRMLHSIGGRITRSRLSVTHDVLELCQYQLQMYLESIGINAEWDDEVRGFISGNSAFCVQTPFERRHAHRRYMHFNSLKSKYDIAEDVYEVRPLQTNGGISLLFEHVTFFENKYTAKESFELSKLKSELMRQYSQGEDILLEEIDESILPYINAHPDIEKSMEETSL